MTRVTTTQILARRARELACGRECVEWAIGLLEDGLDAPALRVLSGLIPPFNHFEIAELRERVLRELSPPELRLVDPVAAYVREFVASSLTDPGRLVRTYQQVAELAIELGYPRELQEFYLISFAWDDLQWSEDQWHWPGANRGNINQIMEENARAFLNQGPREAGPVELSD